MNKHVIPSLKKDLEVIKWVLADKNWGREISDEDEFKTYRQLEERKKREYQKAIKILMSSNGNTAEP
jgi:hypothetical protein